MAESRSVSWSWFGAAMVGIVTMMTPYAVKGFTGGPLFQVSAPAQTPPPEFTAAVATVTKLESKVSALEASAQERAFNIREIQSFQEREHKLLVQIARKMGIEVVD